MKRTWFVLLAAACVGDTPASSTSPISTHSSDTAAPTVPVLLKIFEEDRACFGLLEKELTERYWAGWSQEEPYSDCTADIGRRDYPMYATTDGLCLRFTNSLQSTSETFAECVVDDPWIRPCEEVAGCCNKGDNRDFVTCYPNSAYEP